MSRLLALAALGLGVIVSTTACGGSASPSQAASSVLSRAQSAAAAASSAAAAAGGDSSSPAAAGGAVDCSAITKDDLAKFLVYTQILAQISTPDTVAAIKSKSITDYTPESFAAILAKLQVLAGHPAPGMGDPAAALEFYGKANDSAKALLDSASVTQAQLDAYQAQVGGVASILGKQVAINAAIGENCPKIS
jgi:hypothetical protein